MWSDHITFKEKYYPLRYTAYSTVVFTFVLVGSFVMSLAQSQIGMKATGFFGYKGVAPKSVVEAISQYSFLGYWIHNSSIAFFSWLTGITVIGPFYILYHNGMDIGSFLATATAYMINGNPQGLWMWVFIIPHGIFEIPAILIAAGTGLYIGRAAFQRVTGERDVDLVYSFKVTIIPLIAVFALLALAGFIESHISPYLATAVMNAVYHTHCTYSATSGLVCG